MTTYNNEVEQLEPTEPLLDRDTTDALRKWTEPRLKG